MKKYNFSRIFFGLLAGVLLLSMLTACGETKLTLKTNFTLNNEDRAYYKGDEFDSSVKTEKGTFCRIPQIFTVDDKGNKSEDISHSKNVTYSGYDMNKVGKQTVEVNYECEGKKAKTTYEIEVREQTILFIEASDPMHLNYGAFKVGDKFTTHGLNSDGDEFGLTVFLHMKDPSKPQVGYFTNAEMMKELEVDTSDCALDKSGRFTKPGTFTVLLTYKGFKTNYQIKVEK